LIECDGERKHLLAEEHLRTHAVGTGLFMILVARAPAMVWNVKRSAGGVICNLFTRRSFIKHYSFHIWDPTWGHITIKMAGHPPFDAQVYMLWRKPRKHHYAPAPIMWSMSALSGQCRSWRAIDALTPAA